MWAALDYVIFKSLSCLFRKNQCKSLVSEGAEGILQAMLLSFGGFRLTESDLRLNMDPLVLHNDIAFHRLIYRNDTINIIIKHGTGEQSPVISVALEGMTSNCSFLRSQFD